MEILQYTVTLQGHFFTVVLHESCELNCVT